MKPRIRLRYGIWCCVSWAGPYGRISGDGYTALDAYNEWLRAFEEAAFEEAVRQSCRAIPTYPVGLELV